MPVLVGIISDTHGVIRKEALKALEKSDIIIHAGDIGTIDIIKELETIAPVYVIRGNNDKGKWADEFKETEVVEINGTRIYIIHDRNDIDFDPKSKGVDIVICGHSHRLSKSVENGILYINPGGAGRKRFKLPLTVALLYLLDNGEKKVEFLYI